MSFVPAPGAPTSFDGWTLVVACAGHGNVGQLAADLLINTLQLSHAGSLASRHVLPCCGNDALGDAPRGALTTALEVYAHDSRRLAILQQRAPAARGAQRALADDVAAWAERAGFGRLVALAGLDSAHAASASQIGAAAFRYASPHAPFPPATSGGPTPEGLGWASLESEELGGVKVAEARSPPWPLLAAAGARGLRHAIALLLFCAEGDNAPHAAQLAGHTAALLALPVPATGFRAPLSWRSAFGSRAEDDDAF
jgi:hypothetical protein